MTSLSAVEELRRARSKIQPDEDVIPSKTADLTKDWSPSTHAALRAAFLSGDGEESAAEVLDRAIAAEEAKGAEG